MILSDDYYSIEAKFAKALVAHGWVANTGPGIAIATKPIQTAVRDKEAVAYLNHSSECVDRLGCNYLSEGRNMLSAMRASWQPINLDVSDVQLAQHAAEFAAELEAFVADTYAMPPGTGPV
ncbi:hypothetical protein ACQKEM_15030 [Pseudomonas sp. NPDC077382]